jgi:hypothetical protein
VQQDADRQLAGDVAHRDERRNLGIAGRGGEQAEPAEAEQRSRAVTGPPLPSQQAGREVDDATLEKRIRSQV